MVTLETRRALAQADYHTKQFCLRNFGFLADPKKSLQQNFNKIIKTPHYHPQQQPSNLTFHNLCKLSTLPLNTKTLLGLSLKYCISGNNLNQNINKTLLQMAYSIRTKCHLNEIGYDGSADYDKQIYTKNKSWNPPPASLTIEDKLTEFGTALKAQQNKLIQKNSARNLNNLTYAQIKTLNILKQNKNLIIKPSDKNLGPAVLDTSTYIKQTLNEHLLTKDYRQLTELEAKLLMDKARNTLQKLITDHQDILSKSEYTYFKRNIYEFKRTPIFYGLPKVHKTPITLRPVVSSSNSFLAIFSTWLDFKMKELLPFVKSFVRNSTTIIAELKALTIPEEALIFTADATAMYTNIDTRLGIAYIRDFISTHIDKLPTTFPSNLFIQVLIIVMKFNVFTFADTYWLQLAGTAMGTPTACSYATVSFGHYENNVILTEFNSNLLYYKRYIDDIIGIWLPPNKNKTTTWNNFKERLNSWGTLRWNIEEPTNSTHFLDLNISKKGSSITTSTFQKPLNLYLYIPPLSAHPPSCFKGLIHGELRRYWAQNNPTDFAAILSNFILRLTARGHKLENLIPLISEAAASLDCQFKTRRNNDSNTLYVHWHYHPNGIQRQTIRRLYNNILKDHIPFDNMQVAISRPKNIKDILTCTKLIVPDNLCLQTLIKQNAKQRKGHTKNKG